METLSSREFGDRDRGGLLRFLSHCKARVDSDGEPRIASISLRVRDLDPLAVLQSIHESDQPHLYLERGSVSVSGAEAVVKVSVEGRDRFSKAQQFVHLWSSRIIATGDLDGWFSGPLFFHAFSFDEQNNPAGTVFIPKWQVCRTDQDCVAVANVKVDGQTDMEREADRILRAHGAFSNATYFQPKDRSELGPVTVEAEDPDHFLERVSKALEAINRGEVSKVVLARWMDLVAGKEFHPLETLATLREAYPDCFSFSFSRGTGASWIGATPERLMRLSRGQFETEAIAGSVPRGKGLAEDAKLGGRLLSSDKDLREHEFVVGTIRRVLEGIGLTPNIGRQPHLLRLSNVQHLRTPISGKITPDISLMQLVEELHPTPAVGGVPKQEASRLIGKLEPFVRGLYTGCLGWEKPGGEGESVVALRTARMEGTRARLFAGAGIVDGSSPDLELLETEIKLGAMAGALGAI